MSENIYEKLLSQLKSSGLIKYFDDATVLANINSSSLIKISTKVSKIIVVDNNLCYKNESGDITCCPYIETQVSDSGYWLSDKIDPPNFDILQGGNLRKAEEAESSYCCAMVCSILQDQTFFKEFEDVCKSYNFEDMVSNDAKPTFKELLTSWQDIQSTIINIIVSAAKYSISNQKKDSELFLTSGLEQEEKDGLRDLALSIKSINFKYSTTVLSPGNVKKLNKIEILRHIDERNSEINSIILKSKYGLLYKIMNLSTEYINPIQKKRITNYVRQEVERMYSENEKRIQSLYGDKTDVIIKLRRRAYNLERSSIRRQYVNEYIKNREEFKMPRKA